MSLRLIPGLFLAAFVLGQGLWILAVSPDPPAGVKTATRKSRQIIAIGSIILGVFLVALFTTQFVSE
jgi:hypothetical protein